MKTGFIPSPQAGGTGIITWVGKSDSVKLKVELIKLLYLFGTSKKMPDILDKIWINGGGSPAIVNELIDNEDMICDINIYGNTIGKAVVIKEYMIKQSIELIGKDIFTYVDPEKPLSYNKNDGIPMSVKEWIEYWPEVKEEIRVEKIDDLINYFDELEKDMDIENTEIEK